MSQVVVVGSVNADITVTVARHPVPGETLLGGGGGTTPGGKGANQACAAARLGADVVLVGAVGQDANATAATELLAEAGVDLEHVERLDAPTGLAVVTVADGGENTVLVVPGANGLVGRELVDKHCAPIQSADLVLLQGEIPADGFARAIQLARNRVVVNLAPVIEVPQDALLQADPLVANEHEAGLICAQFGLDADGTPEQLALRLRGAGFASVVLTLGPQGSLVAAGETVTHIDTPSVAAVDTVGAGDAFTGALCGKLVQGASLIDACRFASRVAAFSVTRPGAQPSYPHAGDSLPRETSNH
ncbi:ribokinase [Corynebacterium sp. BCW_4722]|nr:ribokinase [Corynebacterium sp. BCW_4722]